LQIDWSVLVQAEEISIDQMSTIISGLGKVTKLASKWIDLPNHSVAEALRLVTACLNVSLVEAKNYTATYYGKFVVDESDVCILVKADKGKDGRISVAIKSNSQALSDGLLEELEYMCGEDSV